MRKRLLGWFVAGFMLFGGSLVAQESKAPTESAKPKTAWKFEFTVSEIEKGKVINDRTYTMLLVSDRSERISSGNQVPIVTTVNNSTASTSTQYLSFGLKIDCEVREIQDGVFQARVNFENSSIVGPERPVGSNPLVRTLSGSSTFVVHPAKKEVVISVDDVNTERRYQVAVFAELLK